MKMKDFKLDEDGDLIIQKDIVYVTEEEELIQKIRQILGTKKGEWFLNEEEGISYSEILTKNPNMDLVRDSIQDALLQIDERLLIEEFDTSITGRKLDIAFTVINQENEEEINLSISF